MLLQIQDALHAHSVDNIALQQNYILSIQSTLHTHRADNVLFEGGAFSGDHVIFCDDTISVVLVDLKKSIVLITE
jgi:hypothetical protein